MSPDARNSILIWIQGLLFVGVCCLGLWLARTFDLQLAAWDRPLSVLSVIFGAFGMAWFVRGLWMRRASHPRNPNTR